MEISSLWLRKGLVLEPLVVWWASSTMGAFNKGRGDPDSGGASQFPSGRIEPDRKKNRRIKEVRLLNNRGGLRRHSCESRNPEKQKIFKNDWIPCQARNDRLR